MAALRVRIELKRPAQGIEMSKLKELSEEAQKFLRMVAEDLRLNPNDGKWVAKDFYNQGLGFNAEYQDVEIDADTAAAYLHALDGITTVGPETNWGVRGIRPQTIVQSARVAKIADEGEIVRIGLLNGTDHVEWRPLPLDRAATVIEHFNVWVEYRGMLQGMIHTIFKESSPPYFTLRDFASGQIVHCEFNANDWPTLHKALERKDAPVFVAGWIRTRRLDRKIDYLRVEKLQGTKPMNREELHKFFGSAPGWTGDITTDQFIDSIRDDAE